MSAASHAASADERVPVRGLIALGLILTPWLVRATSAHVTLPYWDMDPMVVPPTMSGLGPAGSMLVDAVVLFGAVLGLWEARRSSWRDGAEHGVGQDAWRAWLYPAIAFGLVLIGVGPIVCHGWLREVAYVQHQRVGAAWGAAMIGGLALWHLARDAKVRAVGRAAIMGFVVLLAVKGAAQMLVDHPAMVADFERGKDRLFAANGWTPESPMARGYARRLMQNEATGWFGLSNVYASFAAAGVLAWAGVAWVVLKQRAELSARWMKIGVAAGLIAAVAALAMSQSKGGFGALLLGIAAWGVWWVMLKWRWRFAGLVAPALVTLTLLGVVARGLIGERIGELSILFRWFYMQAAVRIATGFELPASVNGPAVRVGNALRGVGPDGFKDAYLIAKNPLSPEEVASPHSVLLDWWACLGVPGLAWGAVLVVGLVLIGRRVRNGNAARADATSTPNDASESESPIPPLRPLIRAVCVIGAAAVLAALLAARGAIDESGAIVAVGGLVAWCVTGAAALSAILRGGAIVRLGVAAMATALAVHAQIEVTASHPTSCGLFVALLALAAAGAKVGGSPAPAPGFAPVPHPDGSRRAARFARHAWWFVGGGARAIVLVLAIGLLWGGVAPAWRWEQTLRETAMDLQPVAEARRRMEEAAGMGMTEQREAITALASDLQARIGRPVEASGPGVERGMRVLELAITAPVIERLRIGITPFDWRLMREAGRQAVRNMPGSKPGSPWSDLALVWPSTGLFSQPRDDEPGIASMHYWNASAWDAHWRHIAPAPGDHIIGAALLRASLRLDPYNIMTWMRLADDAAEAGRADEAKAAARRVLELDALLRLDPLRQLDERQRARMERLAR